MASPTSPNGNGVGVLRWLCALCCLIGLGFFALWPLSFQYYSTLGIEREHWESRQTVSSRYYRLRWPGDGSLRIGGGGYTHPPDPDDLTPTGHFDLDEHFMEAPRRETPQSFLNQVGFWWQSSGSAFDAKGNPWQCWVGVPSFLPAVFFGWLALHCWRRFRRQNLAPHTKRRTG